MVYIEKVDDPFNEFHLNSFGLIRDEESIKDALKYTTNITGNILVNKKIEGFQYHGYSFTTCLVKDEKNTWLGYISLYNDIFVKEQLNKFKVIALPLLEKISSQIKMAEFYYKKFKLTDCQNADIECVNKLILESFSAEELVDYCLEFQNIMYEIPQNLFIEFALYDRVVVFPEDINGILEQLYKLLEEHPDFSNCNIIIRSEKNEIVFGNKKYKKDEKKDFCYFYLKESNPKESLERRLAIPDKEE